MALYYLWLARNDARETKSMEDPEALARRCVHLTEEWRMVREQRAPKAPTLVERWSPPEEGWKKINTDGALNKSSEKGGGGLVVRNHHGSFLAAACHFFPLVSDPEEVELRACLRAAKVAKEMALDKVELETDCLGVVSKLKSMEIDRSLQGPLVEEIKRELRSLADHRVR
jgi:hypothetical protein